MKLSNGLPILDWGRRYRGALFAEDAMAALIVTIMLIPQSLAYALLAGLPPEMGLYASILPLIAYTIFGTSKALAVGPVAVVSLMTAAAIGALGLPPALAIAAAIALAFLSGVMLVALGVLRLGFLANFLSHPVISGFITASGVIIAASQVKHILGVEAGGATLIDVLLSLARAAPDVNWATALIGVSVLAFLFWVRGGLQPLLMRLGLKKRAAGLLTKAGPAFAVIATTLAAWFWSLDAQGVALVGSVPNSLPPLTVSTLLEIEPSLWRDLAGPALLISIVGFAESVSVAQTLAAKKRQQIVPDQELIGLGAANVAASVSGGYPVTGGFARSVVNFDAGAATPAAGGFTALGILLVTVFLTPLLFFLPKATLAATIIVAVLSLVDFSVLGKTWRYSKADFAAVAATILLTLTLGVEVGVSAGVLLSVGLYLFKTSRPHIAEVGRIDGTEHYRNIKRYSVLTEPSIVSLRVDESLYFANARYLEEYVLNRVVGDPAIRHVILACPAINEIDYSALESLEAVNSRLEALGVRLHLSEVKGPVMDRLKRSSFLDELTGEIFLSHHQAVTELSGAAAPSAPSAIAREDGAAA
ncbi:MAG: sulfate permease [Alphaproteobacteria bacterium]|nr:sulfate permease [Alphaproteobacteria bacterium]